MQSALTASSSGSSLAALLAPAGVVSVGVRQVNVVTVPAPDSGQQKSSLPVAAVVGGMWYNMHDGCKGGHPMARMQPVQALQVPQTLAIVCVLQ